MKDRLVFSLLLARRRINLAKEPPRNRTAQSGPSRPLPHYVREPSQTGEVGRELSQAVRVNDELSFLQVTVWSRVRTTLTTGC